MFGWLRRLFGKREDPRDAAMRELAKALPGEMIQQLVRDLAEIEEAKCRAQGYSLSGTERAKLEKELEYRLRNPGRHRGPIPVRVQVLYGHLADRCSERYSSSASSPLG